MSRPIRRRRKRDVAERFWEKVDKSSGPDGCWLWVRSTNKGYGQFHFRGTPRPAPRIAWQLAYGVALESWQFVCHRCDNPPCVNPAHLFIGTSLDNQRDKVLKGRQPHGEAWAKKLTANDVHEIRGSKEPQKVLAVRFGVHQSTICRVRNRDRWHKTA